MFSGLPAFGLSTLNPNIATNPTNGAPLRRYPPQPTAEMPYQTTAVPCQPCQPCHQPTKLTDDPPSPDRGYTCFEKPAEHKMEQRPDRTTYPATMYAPGFRPYVSSSSPAERPDQLLGGPPQSIEHYTRAAAAHGNLNSTQLMQLTPAEVSGVRQMRLSPSQDMSQVCERQAQLGQVCERQTQLELLRYNQDLVSTNRKQVPVCSVERRKFPEGLPNGIVQPVPLKIIEKRTQQPQDNAMPPVAVMKRSQSWNYPGQMGYQAEGYQAENVNSGPQAKLCGKKRKAFLQRKYRAQKKAKYAKMREELEITKQKFRSLDAYSDIAMLEDYRKRTSKRPLTWSFTATFPESKVMSVSDRMKRALGYDPTDQITWNSCKIPAVNTFAEKQKFVDEIREGLTNAYEADEGFYRISPKRIGLYQRLVFTNSEEKWIWVEAYAKLVNKPSSSPMIILILERDVDAAYYTGTIGAALPSTTTLLDPAFTNQANSSALNGFGMQVTEHKSYLLTVTMKKGTNDDKYVVSSCSPEAKLILGYCPIGKFVSELQKLDTLTAHTMSGVTQQCLQERRTTSPRMVRRRTRNGYILVEQWSRLISRQGNEVVLEHFERDISHIEFHCRDKG